MYNHTDLCDTVATQRNNITKVEVSLIDVNDHPPQFVPDSLLAAVAEEAEFGTTVTELQVDACACSIFHTFWPTTSPSAPITMTLLKVVEI